MYPSQHSPFGAAFVCQAGNFWTLLRSLVLRQGPGLFYSAVHRLPSIASPFDFHYLLGFLKSSIGCLLLLSYLLFNSVLSWTKHVLCNFYVLFFKRILGAFSKLRKANVSFVMSVRLSVCSYGTTRLPLNGFV